MIRLLEENDMETVCKIVNDNWRNIYTGYINADLLTKDGCNQRREKMIKDFKSGRLSNYVYEDNGKVAALLSIGDTEDEDKEGSFEVWRLYIAKEYQHKGIGKVLLNFAEQQAFDNDYEEIVIWSFKNNINAILFYKSQGYFVDKEEYLWEPYLTYGTRLVKELPDEI